MQRPKQGLLVPFPLTRKRLSKESKRAHQSGEIPTRPENYQIICYTALKNSPCWRKKNKQACRWWFHTRIHVHIEKLMELLEKIKNDQNQSRCYSDSSCWIYCCGLALIHLVQRHGEVSLSKSRAMVYFWAADKSLIVFNHCRTWRDGSGESGLVDASLSGPSEDMEQYYSRYKPGSAFFLKLHQTAAAHLY